MQKSFTAEQYLFKTEFELIALRLFHGLSTYFIDPKWR